MKHDPSTPSTPSIPDVSAAFEQLKVAARELNTVSDTLGLSIAELDIALKKLNLGIPSWVEIEGEEDDDGSGSYWSNDLGYAKVRGNWGIAVRHCVGNYSAGDFRVQEQWPFSEAPRALRVKGVEKLPELLENLTKDARRTAAKIAEKIGRAQAVVAAVTGKAPEPPPTATPYTPGTPTPDPPPARELSKAKPPAKVASTTARKWDRQ